ncbi:RNA polymerase sigma factor, sigma-70 family [Singulisphaera sp. GP187]|uniref:RNA polymerase sigma factor n=1 Tax=Singulisphaera sp. GP187 TaxID=1882752 RepID=UPI00092865A9|nr:RNA polymerase sigma factor [Singulisphaera sp. GP187]SIO65713.1 RNA polymerase sigma factor, sigma-70 family [Singulisphaera sp. GP187]
MASRPLGATIRRIERLFHLGSVAGMSEVQLLDRFVLQHDEAAFEALVTRHGPMVLGVCRQWLRDPNDVEDAFQATFLVLVRKAGSLRDRDLLGNWLYGVAYRVAIRSRAEAAKRWTRETGGVDDQADPHELSSQERSPWLSEEVNRLPEKYRAPIVLCYLEGRTHEEAAEQLCWPVGTVKGRLARARDLLRSRLSRRGLAPSVGVLTAALSRDASAAVPVPLIGSTVRAASTLAAAKVKGVAAGLIPAQVAHLMEGVCHAMFLSKLRVLTATIAVAGLLTASAGGLVRQTSGDEGKRKEQDSTVAGPRDATKTVTTVSQGPSHRSDTVAPLGDPVITPPQTSPRGPTAKTTTKFAIARGRIGGVQAYASAGGGAIGPAIPDGERRVTIAKMGRRVAANDTSPRTKMILKKLDDPISMSFGNDTRLEDVLKYIKSATTGANDNGIPIYVDPVGLKEAEVPLTSTVILDLEGVPLKTTLRLLLKQVGLAYCVKDGLLIISSPKGIVEELEEAESIQEFEPPQ